MDSETYAEAVKQLRELRANAKSLRRSEFKEQRALADDVDELAKHMVIYIFDGADPDAT